MLRLNTIPWIAHDGAWLHPVSWAETRVSIQCAITSCPGDLLEFPCLGPPVSKSDKTLNTNVYRQFEGFTRDMSAIITFLLSDLPPKTRPPVICHWQSWWTTLHKSMCHSVKNRTHSGLNVFRSCPVTYCWIHVHQHSLSTYTYILYMWLYMHTHVRETVCVWPNYQPLGCAPWFCEVSFVKEIKQMKQKSQNNHLTLTLTLHLDKNRDYVGFHKKCSFWWQTTFSYIRKHC